MSLASRIALAFIRVYKIVLSPLFAGSCRYTPGCADYMSESISRFGFLRGGWLGTRRLCKCHPFGGHGFDPVPQTLATECTEDTEERFLNASRASRRSPARS